MVRRDAQHTRTRVISGVKSQGCVDKQVAAKTRREVEAKWASDAVQLSELDSEASISRRFGLTQGSGEDTKTRLIDDLSDSAINQAVQVCESPQPHTTDVLACLLLECLESFPRSGLSGRSYDLKAAYRQLGLSQEALKDSCVAFHDHESNRPAIHQLLALPFGATRSVHSFLRVIHSVWALGCSIAFLWTVYFDDFPVVARDADTSGLTDHIPRFFKLLGWQFAEAGPKAEQFEKTFSCLGVRVDLNPFTGGRVEFSNTPSRKDELVKAIDMATSTKLLDHKEAQRLRGRLQFATGQIFGRTSKLCLKALDDHVRCGAQRLSSDSLRALSLFRQTLIQGFPRSIGRPAGQTLVLFTDAAYEITPAGPSCGLGAVLYTQHGTPLAFFSHRLSPQHVERLGGSDKKTIIFEAELLAYVASIILWKSKIRNRPLSAFIDNNSARDACISGRARNEVGQHLIALLLAVEDLSGVNAWISRVPSPSNPSDILSKPLSAQIQFCFHGVG